MKPCSLEVTVEPYIGKSHQKPLQNDILHFLSQLSEKGLVQSIRRKLRCFEK